MAYQLTSLGISVLALLRERPMHGYKVFQTLVAGRRDRIVKVRPGSLYHIIDRLAEEKLIRRAETGRDGNRPERTICEITDTGAEALNDRVRELLANPVDEFPQFVVALAETHTLDAATVVDALDTRIATLQAGVAEMLTLCDAGVTAASPLIALDYLVTTTQAEIGWLCEFTDSLRSGRRRWPQAPEVSV